MVALPEEDRAPDDVLPSDFRAFYVPAGVGVPIVEIGAGSGRLAHLLNATGKLKPHSVVATEPDADGPNMMAGEKKPEALPHSAHGSPPLPSVPSPH